jgi:D-galactarolactone cycloisomerase
MIAMRIAGIDAIAIDIPLTKNFGGSTYAVRKRSTVITRLQTAGGPTSEVYNGDDHEGGAEIVRLIREQLAPQIVGDDVFARERIWSKLFALAATSRDRKTLLAAIACIDCAVWDVVGKVTGRSVWQLLGGYVDKIPIITIGGYYHAGGTLADIAREMEAYRRAGMAGCKFKVGGLSAEADAQRVRVAREAAGPDFMLAVDANRAWTAEEAVRFARLIEPLNISWFEEPCLWHDDAAQMARVRSKVAIPINAGQSEITSSGVRRLIDAGAVDMVNYDASAGGGVTDWRRAAALCATAGLKLTHHEEAQIAQHLIAAVPEGVCVECFADPERDPVWQHLWVNRPAIAGGMMSVSSGAGFGLELDASMIAKYRVA